MEREMRNLPVIALGTWPWGGGRRYPQRTGDAHGLISPAVFFGDAKHYRSLCVKTHLPIKGA